MRKAVAAAGVLSLVVVLTGAIAIAGRMSKDGAEAANAAQAAIEAVDGRWATLDLDSPSGSTWKFDVTRSDGSQASVELNDQLRTVSVRDKEVYAAAKVGRADDRRAEADDRRAEADDRRAEADDRGSRSEKDDSEETVRSSDADRAAEAALKATGGGRVHDVDRESEGGATWEVEIIDPNGKEVDVLLDVDFRVLSVGNEQEDNEGRDDDDRNEGKDDDDRNEGKDDV